MSIYSIYKGVLIISFSYIFYLKFSGLHIGVIKKFFTAMIYIVIFTILWRILDYIIEPYKSLLIILLSGIYIKIVTKGIIKEIIVSMAIAIATSHILYFLTSTVALFIVNIIFCFINGNIDIPLNENGVEELIWKTAPIAFAIEVITTIIIIRIKIPIQKLSDNMGIIISGIILIFYSLLRQDELSKNNWILLILGIILCTLGLRYYFKKEAAIIYNEMIKTVIEERFKIKLKSVQDINDHLEKAAHRDAKKIPAYRKAVEGLIDDIPEGKTKNKAVELLNELKIAEQHQAHEINNKLMKNKKLPSTGMYLLDAVFSHMLDIAKQNNIDFDLIVNGNMNGIIDIITQSHLETLAADLIENAIIATMHEQNSLKSVFVYFWISNGTYEIRIDDNGPQFDKYAIMQLGIYRISTHSDTGGNGIGYMTIFEIINTCNASLIITERLPKSSKYTKTVAVRFDNRGLKIIKSYRAEELRAINDGRWIIDDCAELYNNKEVVKESINNKVIKSNGV